MEGDYIDKSMNRPSSYHKNTPTLTHFASSTALLEPPNSMTATSRDTKPSLFTNRFNSQTNLRFQDRKGSWTRTKQNYYQLENRDLVPNSDRYANEVQSEIF